MTLKEAQVRASAAKKSDISPELAWVISQLQQAIDGKLPALIVMDNALIYTKETLSSLQKLGYDVSKKERIVKISGW